MLAKESGIRSLGRQFRADTPGIASSSSRGWISRKGHVSIEEEGFFRVVSRRKEKRKEARRGNFDRYQLDSMYSRVRREKVTTLSGEILGERT